MGNPTPPSSLIRFSTSISGTWNFWWYWDGFLGGRAIIDGSEIRRENQLRLVVYPIIYEVYPHHPTGGFLAGFRVAINSITKIIMHQMVPLFYYIFMHEFSQRGTFQRPLDLEVSVSYTPGSTNIAGCKMGSGWKLDAFPIEHGDIPASYVSLQECRKCNS